MIQSSNEHDSSFTKNSKPSSGADASSQVLKDSAAHYNAATFAFATQVVIDCGVPQMLQLPGIDHDEHNLAYESGARIDKVLAKSGPVSLPGSAVGSDTTSLQNLSKQSAAKSTMPVPKRTLNRIAPRSDSKSLSWKQRLLAKREKLTSEAATNADSIGISVAIPAAVASTKCGKKVQPLAEVSTPIAHKLTSSRLSESRPSESRLSESRLSESRLSESRPSEFPEAAATMAAVTSEAVSGTASKTSRIKTSQKGEIAKYAANMDNSDQAALLALAAVTSAAQADRSFHKVEKKQSRSTTGRSSPLVPAALMFPKISDTEGFLTSASPRPKSERWSKKAAERKSKPDAPVVPAAGITTAAVVEAEEQDFPISTATFSVAEPEAQEEECYADWFKRVVVKNRWATWFTTFYVHWLLLLALTVIIVHGPENAANLLINATMASVEEFETPAFEVDVSDPQPETEPEPVAEPVKVNEYKLEEQEVQLSESVLDKLSPDGNVPAAAESSSSGEEAEPKPTKRAPNPAPASAISEGSFSVWTEPTYPVAGEPYRIIIQVCLPEGIQRYNIADLEGVVVGSDGYRKPIPGSLRGFLPVENGYGRLIIPIVSADATVKDTVYIRSKLLKEAQKLLIEF